MGTDEKPRIANRRGLLLKVTLSGSHLQFVLATRRLPLIDPDCFVKTKSMERTFEENLNGDSLK
jgi:hypothetical protein